MVLLGQVQNFNIVEVKDVGGTQTAAFGFGGYALDGSFRAYTENMMVHLGQI